MKFMSPSHAAKQIVERCSSDMPTKLRRRYDPWYLSFDKQQGSRV
jgi:hypothetical protein